MAAKNAVELCLYIRISIFFSYDSKPNRTMCVCVVLHMYVFVYVYR